MRLNVNYWPAIRFLLLILTTTIVLCPYLALADSIPSSAPSGHSISGAIPLMGSPEERADQNAKWDASYKIFLLGKMAQEDGDWNQASEDFNQCQPVGAIPQLIQVQTARHDFEIGDYPPALALYGASVVWLNGHVQGLAIDDMMIYAFLLMDADQSNKAIDVYSDAYPWFSQQGWYDDPRPMPIQDFTKDNPPFSPTQFESMALTAAGAISAEDSLGQEMSVTLSGQTFTPNDPYFHPYSSRMTMKRLNLALQLQPASPYAEYMIGKYYKHVPGRETDAAEAFRKAYEYGGSDMESRVLGETKFATPEFHKAFDARFSDVPH